MRHIKLFEHFANYGILDTIVCQHQSRLELDELVPQTYEEIAKHRSQEYMKGRIKSEREYHEFLSNSDSDTSFVYATIVGFNKMDSVDEYEGNTYYFRMTKEILENSLFEIVDKELSYGPVFGLVGLEGSINFWKKNQGLFEPYEDPNVGTINPRIEIIIGTTVKNIWKVNKQ